MIFISRDLLKITGYEHDIVIELVTAFVDIYSNYLEPEYKLILLQTLAHEMEKIENDERKESNDDIS